MSSPSRFFLSPDHDGHWYLVPEASRSEWEHWINLPSDDERSWECPAFAQRFPGGPSMVTFSDPQLTEARQR
jgi:hypothetical protein